MNTFTKLAGAAALTITATSAVAEGLIIVPDTAFVPFEFRQDGVYVGFDAGIWDAIAADLGVNHVK